MIRKSKKKIISLLLAAAMTIALAGCGGNGTGTGDSGVGSDGQAQGGDAADSNIEVAMGRYVEEEIDLSGQLAIPVSMSMLDDGRIVIIDAETGVFVSKDQGVSWNKENPDWFNAMQKDGLYITTMAMAPDGTAAVVYNPDTGGEEFAPIMKLVLPDGTDVPVDMNLTEEDLYVDQVVINEDGRIFARTFDSIFEVRHDGSSERILTSDIYAAWVWVKGDLMFIDSYLDAIEAPMIYDLDAKDYVEDSVLIEFMEENYANRSYNGSYSGTMHLMPGDDKTVYVIGPKGIHRHVIGGNMMEQIVDGNLSLLSNPDYRIVSILPLEGDAFIALFDNNKVVKFIYDPNVPSMPENMVTIYSLRDNADIRQAIAAFQMQHPDTYVSYQIGMSEDDSVTREDAVKKLNTEIMAGAGPDLIVMDDLPFNSYVSKGILLDLTDYLAEYSMQTPLFDNMIEALKFDGKAYIVPGTVTVPLMAAKDANTENLTDLSGIGDTVERLRSEHPGEDIIGICSENDIMKRFAGISAPKWIMADGTLDREIVGRYLEQCKRIYDAQMDGIDGKIVSEYERKSEGQAAYGGSEVDKIDWGIQTDIIAFIGGTEYLLSGWTVSYYTYAELLSLNHLKDYADTKVVPMQDQCSNVFKPQTMLGINAASGKLDVAKTFMDVFLQAEVQAEFGGLPLNRAGYDIQFTTDESYLGPYNERLYLSVNSADGTTVDYTIYWPSDEEIAALKTLLASADTAYIPDGVLEDAVFDNGSRYMRGQQTLEEALDEIEKAMTIYMAE